MYVKITFLHVYTVDIGHGNQLHHVTEFKEIARVNVTDVLGSAAYFKMS